MPAVNFFSEDISFKPQHPRKITAWIKACILEEKKPLGQLNYIFCSDKYLLQMNQDYLNHNTLTDVITFAHEDADKISGDIFISIERVEENAKKFNVLFNDELHRVMIHGVLHLVGYKDKTSAAKAEMQKKEDAYLSLRL